MQTQYPAQMIPRINEASGRILDYLAKAGKAVRTAVLASVTQSNFFTQAIAMMVKSGKIEVSKGNMVIMKEKHPCDTCPECTGSCEKKLQYEKEKVSRAKASERKEENKYRKANLGEKMQCKEIGFGNCKNHFVNPDNTCDKWTKKEGEKEVKEKKDKKELGKIQYINIDEIYEHPENAKLLPPLSEDERDNLKEKIEKEPEPHPLVVIKNENTGYYYALDGNNRLGIYDELGYEGVLPCIVKGNMSIEDQRTYMENCSLGRRNLTKEQKAEIAQRQVARGIGQKDVAKKLGLSQQTISNVTSAVKEVRKTAENEAVQVLASAGNSQNEIAKEVGISQQSVSNLTKNTKIGKIGNPDLYETEHENVDTMPENPAPTLIPRQLTKEEAIVKAKKILDENEILVKAKEINARKAQELAEKKAKKEHDKKMAKHYCKECGKECIERVIHLENHIFCSVECVEADEERRQHPLETSPTVNYKEKISALINEKKFWETENTRLNNELVQAKEKILRLEKMLKDHGIDIEG